jgi:hypothetical protein
MYCKTNLTHATQGGLMKSWLADYWTVLTVNLIQTSRYKSLVRCKKEDISPVCYNILKGLKCDCPQSGTFQIVWK